MEVESWRSFLPPEEAAAYEAPSSDTTNPVGEHAALLVIDSTLAFTGRDATLSLERATEEFPTACGPAAWDALPHIQALLSAFRSKRLPIIFTRNDPAVRRIMGGSVKRGHRQGSRNPDVVARGNGFVGLIAPQPDELILEKTRASVFFGTPLATLLFESGMRSVVVCGATTSGCIRASVVDAFSYGFDVTVIEDACFDRSPTAHRANLWDMDAKYASVRTSEEALAAIGCIGNR